jgi:hypothetical protein
VFFSVATSAVLVVFLSAAGILVGLVGTVLVVSARDSAAEHRAGTWMSAGVGLLVGPLMYAVILAFVVVFD